MPHDWAIMLGEFVGRRGVSLERLQTLCLVAEAGSIMGAAKGDPNRQSLFSRQVKELEGALGIELLDRSAPPYRLTGQGERLMQLTREYFDGMERLLNGAHGRHPLVTIGAGESILQWFVIPLLGRSLKDEPWRFLLKNLTSREAIDGLRRRSIDVAIVPAEDAAGDLKSAAVATYGIVVVAMRELMPVERPVSWSALAGKRLAVLDGRGSLTAAIDRLNGSLPEAVEVTLACTSYPQVIEACAAAEFIGLVPEIASTAAKSAGLIVSKVPELSEIQIQLSLVWSPSVEETRAEVARFVRLLLGTRPAGE